MENDFDIDNISVDDKVAKPIYVKDFNRYTSTGTRWMTCMTTACYGGDVDDD